MALSYNLGSGKHFSASYKASEFCWQNRLDFLEIWQWVIYRDTTLSFSASALMVWLGRDRKGGVVQSLDVSWKWNNWSPILNNKVWWLITTKNCWLCEEGTNGLGLVMGTYKAECRKGFLWVAWRSKCLRQSWNRWYLKGSSSSLGRFVGKVEFKVEGARDFFCHRI